MGLGQAEIPYRPLYEDIRAFEQMGCHLLENGTYIFRVWAPNAAGVRSEERRVGKECRSRWWATSTIGRRMPPP